MKLSSLPPLVLLATSLPMASAWGGLGHQTVALVATNFINVKTSAFFQKILGDTSPEYLAKIATWADSYRYTAAGKFSAPFHFIDSQDNPPTSCGVAFARDCGKEGCIIGAVNNYTTRLLDSKLSASDRNMSAKFIVHFIGDLHQPLHDENLDRGGNEIHVVFDGKPNNLHAVWDTAMPEKLIGGYALADAQKWSLSLTTAIKTGSYKAQAAGWLKGIDFKDPVATSLIWAKEANSYVCTTVMPKGVKALNGTELDGDYYKTAIPVIELQIARAGYRLAAWMNLIAASAKAVTLEEL